MASLASLVNRFVGINELAEVRPAVWTRADTCRLRPIANEDVFLFVKRIDNSAVVRAADPLARRARSRSVATGFVAAMLVIAGLLPSAYNTMAGFTVQNLEQEQNKLKQERAALDLDEAKLLNPARLEQLAKSLKMIEPVPQQVQYLDSKAKDDARNRLPWNGPEASAR
jgi:cell division protein FtsL